MKSKPIPTPRAAVLRKIIDFHMDDRRDWVAQLECGHQQLVRQDPPYTNHHWVTTAQGRLEHIGQQLSCSACRFAAR